MNTWGSFSLTLIDALDTLIIMGNYTEFGRAAELVLENVNLDANVNVSVFETNIRVVGGLLSAHMLSGRVLGVVKFSIVYFNLFNLRLSASSRLALRWTIIGLS